MNISIVLPAYAEEENLIEMLPKIEKTMQSFPGDFNVWVIDTIQPTDNTKEVCEKFDFVNYQPRKNGNDYGDAIRTGIEVANGDWIIIMDADGSHNPQDILHLYQKANEGFDIVIGSRYVQGGNSDNSLILRMMSYMVNFVYRFLFKLKVKDVSDSFRIYNASMLKTLKLTSQNFDIVEEILILFSVDYPKFTYTEVPIYFNKRMYGESKRNLWKFIFSYIGSLKRMYHIKKSAEKAKKTATI